MQLGGEDIDALLVQHMVKVLKVYAREREREREREGGRERGY